MSFFIESADVNKNATFKIISPESIKNVVSGTKLIEIAEESGLDIQILNNKVTPNIVALKDKQKFEYEQKKAKKEQDKKAKANAQKLKEIKFHIGISENDISTKENKILEFLDKHCKVKLVMELRGRENDMENLAKEKFNEILSRFNSFKLDEVKKFGTSFYTFVTK